MWITRNDKSDEPIAEFADTIKHENTIVRLFDVCITPCFRLGRNTLQHVAPWYSTLLQTTRKFDGDDRSFTYLTR